MMEHSCYITVKRTLVWLCRTCLSLLDSHCQQQFLVACKLLNESVGGRPTTQQNRPNKQEGRPLDADGRRRRESMPRDDNPCRIYYATQSGRAKACARRTARLLRELKGREVRSYATLDDALRLLDDALRLIDNDNNNDENGSVSSWAATIQNTELLVLFVSTTGDGEQPDNMKQIWKQLYVDS